MCGRALSVTLLTLAVVLPTPHDYSGTFQGGYSARFIASRVLKGARRVLYPSKQPRGNTGAHPADSHSSTAHISVRVSPDGMCVLATLTKSTHCHKLYPEKCDHYHAVCVCARVCMRV